MNTTEATSKKSILICVRDDYSLICLYTGDILTDLFVQRHSDTRSTVGNIYLAKVNRVLPSIQAAFLDYGGERDGFLGVMDAQYGKKGHQRHQANISNLLHNGDLVMVQIEKETISEKGCKLTTDIALPGRYLVLMPYGRNMNISRKIEDEAVRTRLKNMAETLVPEKVGWIIRTVAQEAPEAELSRDIKELWRVWEQIRKTADEGKRPMLLHTELDLMEQVLRDHLTEVISSVQVDDQPTRRRIEKFVQQLAPRHRLLRGGIRYVDPERLARESQLQRELERAIQKKVWLKCGGFIIVEEMETLTAIDVNTGRNIRGHDQNHTLLETNLEAAEEIARQLRVRNIGGIIIIDFIDMRLRKDRQRVTATLRRHLAADKAASDVLEFTELGLVQITRQRSQESLRNFLTVECPACRGNGRVIHLSG